MAHNEDSLSLWAAVLLLAGGLVLLIPEVYIRLTDLTGGTPWIQIIVGILSIVVSLVLFAGGQVTAKDKEVILK
jgi:hypothetical protein